MSGAHIVTHLAKLRKLLSHHEDARNECIRALIAELSCVKQEGLEVTSHPDVKDILTKESQHKFPDIGVHTQEAQGSIYRLLVEIKPEELTPTKIPLKVQKQAKSYAKDCGVCILTNGVQFVTYIGSHLQHADFFEIQSFAAFQAGQPLASPDLLATELNSYVHNALSLAPGIKDVPTLARYFARSTRAALNVLVKGKGAAFEGRMKVLRQQYAGLFGLSDVKFSAVEEKRFRSALAQFFFYARFAIWALQESNEPVIMQSSVLGVTAAHYLFGNMSSNAHPLGIAVAVQLADRVLEYTDRTAVLSAFAGGSADLAIEQFYEPFLQALDEDMRKEFGVWFTPREIVNFQVAFINTVLRYHHGLTDALDSEEIKVIDPCCGTGSYLIALMNRLHDLHASGGASAAAHVGGKLGTQIWGFDILPAAVMVASLRASLNFDVDIANAADAILTTNSLTGWPGEARQTTFDLLDPDIEQEHDRAQEVKKSDVWVILGNPPYKRDDWESLTGPSTELITAWTNRLHNDYGVSKHTVGDIFCRFWAIAVQRVLSQRKRAVISFITNNIWLNGRGFAQMRECMLREVSDVYIVNLHGDRNGSETDAQGKTCQTVFSRPGLDPGIKVGTAIVTLVKRAGHVPGQPPNIWLRHLRGRAQEDKRDVLAQMTAEMYAPDFAEQVAFNPETLGFKRITPTKDTYWILDDVETTGTYSTWPVFRELLSHSSLGVNENRGGSVMNRSKPKLAEQFIAYFDTGQTNSQVASAYPTLMKNRGRYEAAEVRSEYLATQISFNSSNVTSLQQRPFDFRYINWQLPTTKSRKLLNESRPKMRKWFDIPFANPMLVTTFKAAESTNWSVAAVTYACADQHYLKGDAYCHPLRISTEAGTLGGLTPWTWNTPAVVLDSLYRLWELDKRSSDVLATLGNVAPTNSPLDANRELAAQLLFWHMVTVLHADAYRKEHLPSLRYLWPRVPVSTNLDSVLKSAALGKFTGELYRSANITLPIVPKAFAGVLNAWSPTLPWTSLGGNDAAGVSGKISKVQKWSDQNNGTVTVEVEATDNSIMPVHWQTVPQPVWEKVIGGRQTLRDLLERWRGKEEFNGQTAHEYTGIIRRVAMLVKAGEAASECYKEAAANAATRPQLGLKAEVTLDAIEEDESTEEDEDTEESDASE